jgi:hypothetical protein
MATGTPSTATVKAMAPRFVAIRQHSDLARDRYRPIEPNPDQGIAAGTGPAVGDLLVLFDVVKPVGNVESIARIQIDRSRRCDDFGLLAIAHQDVARAQCREQPLG